MCRNPDYGQGVLEVGWVARGTSSIHVVTLTLGMIPDDQSGNNPDFSFGKKVTGVGTNKSHGASVRYV